MIPQINFLRLSASQKTEVAVWHSHPYWQMGWLVRGRVTIGFMEGEVIFHDSDFYVIAAGHMHRVELAGGTEEYQLGISLSPRTEFLTETAAGVSDFDWLRHRSLIVRGARDIGGALAEILRDRTRATPIAQLAAECRLVALMLSLQSRQAEALVDRHASGDAGGDHALFNDALAVIGRLYGRKGLHVPDMAATCCVSRATLNNLFRRRLGCGPKEFLQRYRTDRAREELRMGRLSLEQIADKVGFSDVYAFSRIFKRFTGVPPGRYRRRHGESPCAENLGERRILP